MAVWDLLTQMNYVLKLLRLVGELLLPMVKEIGHIVLMMWAI
jgi:hypothetical protein